MTRFLSSRLLLVSALVLALLVLLPAVWAYAASRGWVEPFETGAPGLRPPLGRDGRPVPIEQLPNDARAGVMIVRRGRRLSPTDLRGLENRTTTTNR